MDDENLRVRAMDFAIAARASQHEDIVELAQRIYAFLNEDDVPLRDALAYAGDIVGNMPPPIPQQDLGKADQSPQPLFRNHEMLAGDVGGEYPRSPLLEQLRASVEQLDDNDTPTRIVRPVA